MSSPITLSDLTYLPATTVADRLSNSLTASRTAIIDVRDSDHIGGHIKSSTWIPLAQLDAQIPELLRLHKDKDAVVFHCMLSQQRGPQAALRYARAKAAMDVKEAKAAHEAKNGDETKKLRQQVCVLEGGFGAWQARYGENGQLTEAYVKDLWE